MLVLGIESSCDETALAIVRDGVDVVGSLVASQTAVHAKFGGVVPEVAAREHLKVIAPMYRELLRTTGVTSLDIDLVAVTQGPGLIGAILVGVAYAKGVALALNRPLIPVDHVHAHVHGALLGINGTEQPQFPTLALVVSGGHTNLYYMQSPTHFKLLACSIDDACGECFDKVAKLLGLGYPGGPRIEALAQQGRDAGVAMPRMVSQKSRLEFSYSGLKTFVANHLRQVGQVSEQEKADLCASFQIEALGQIVRKVQEAVRLYPEARSVLVAGGVAANQKFRRLMAEHVSLPAFFPKLDYCSDNAAMIAAYGFHIYQNQPEDRAAWLRHDWDAYSRYDFAKALNATSSAT